MFLLKPLQLTFLVTNQCTALCDHCSMDSGPGHKEKLTFEQMRNAIDELSNPGSLNTVIFAGGEPLLLGEELLNAIAHADCLGLNTRVVTNAYWATSPEKAREKLIELREAGLSEVNFSTDDYHEPYVSFENIEYAWHASKGLGFQAVVIANCAGPRSIINTAFIMERLGEKLPMRFDTYGHPNPNLCKPAKDGTIYALSNAYLQLLGRSHRSHIQPPDLYYPENQEKLNGHCHYALRSPAISPNNHFLVCCGMKAEGKEVLDLGSASENSINELVKRADEKILINVLAFKGPVFLKQLIQKHSPKFFFREKYASLCEICEHIFSRPEAVKIIQQHMAELAIHVLAIRDSIEQKNCSNTRED